MKTAKEICELSKTQETGLQYLDCVLATIEDIVNTDSGVNQNKCIDTYGRRIKTSRTTISTDFSSLLERYPLLCAELEKLGFNLIKKDVVIASYETCEQAETDPVYYFFGLIKRRRFKTVPKVVELKHPAWHIEFCCDETKG